jgi:ABC-type molybdenum transport system ATPase subunit/photorepair protein PhrA
MRRNNIPRVVFVTPDENYRIVVEGDGIFVEKKGKDRLGNIAWKIPPDEEVYRIQRLCILSLPSI